MCQVLVAHFGYFTITTQSVLGSGSTLWALLTTTQSVSGSGSTLWALLTTTQSVLGSRSTLWVDVMSGQCVLGSLTHFGWFAKCKVWWNTCHTLGTYRHTLGISAELPKVS